MTERQEALMRILVGLVSGLIIAIWKTLVQVVIIIHWLYALFLNKRHKPMAEFCNSFNSELYRFTRYMTFTTNERPFPFTNLQKVMHPVVMKRKK